MNHMMKNIIATPYFSFFFFAYWLQHYADEYC